MTIEWVDQGPGSDASPPPEPPRAKPRTALLVAVVAIVAAAGVGFGIGRATAHHSRVERVVAVSGEVVLRSHFVGIAAGTGITSRCLSAAPFDDIETGTPVLVTDSNQRFVGATRLYAGSLLDGTCRFAFRLSIPSTGSRYEFQIGNRVGPAVAGAQLNAVIVPFG